MIADLQESTVDDLSSTTSLFEDVKVYNRPSESNCESSNSKVLLILTMCLQVFNV